MFVEFKERVRAHCDVSGGRDMQAVLAGDREDSAGFRDREKAVGVEARDVDK